jgi:hypothetical protein
MSRETTRTSPREQHANDASEQRADTLNLAHRWHAAAHMIHKRGMHTQRVTTRAKQHANDARSSTPMCAEQRVRQVRNTKLMTRLN